MENREHKSDRKESREHLFPKRDASAEKQLVGKTSQLLSLHALAMPLLALSATAAFCYFASPIVVPLVAAVSCAFILSPAVSLLKKIKIPHLLAVVIVMLIAVGIFFAIIYLLGQQLQSLAVDLPHYLEGLTKLSVDLKERAGVIQERFPNLIPDIENLEVKPSALTDASKYLFKGISSAVSFLFSSFLIIFLTFFILYDQEIFRKKLARAFGKSQEGVTQDILLEINNQIRGFMVVKFIVTVALTVVFTVGLLLLKVNYAYIWGPLAALLNLIPYVGSFIGAVPPIIVAGIQTKAVMPMVWVAIFFAVVQVLESNLITPKLTSDTVDLNPLAVLVASMFWGLLWGAIGVILAIPITAAIKVICDHVESLEPIGLFLGGKRE